MPLLPACLFSSLLLAYLCLSAHLSSSYLHCIIQTTFFGFPTAVLPLLWTYYLFSLCVYVHLFVLCLLVQYFLSPGSQVFISFCWLCLEKGYMDRCTVWRGKEEAELCLLVMTSFCPSLCGESAFWVRWRKGQREKKQEIQETTEEKTVGGVSLQSYNYNWSHPFGL